MSTVPPPYDRQASFMSFQTPDAPTVGQDLEAEFNKIDQALDETQSRLAEIQRDDGLLANLSVHPDSLSHAVRSLLAAEAGVPRGNWAPGVIYQPKDVVSHNGSSYLAATEHTAGADFDADLAAGKWLLLSFANDGGTLRSDLASLAPGNGASLVRYDADETVKDRLDALGNLRADLASPSAGLGADLVQYSASEDVRDVIARLDAKGITVENYGAKGDGTTNDAAAVLAMIADTGVLILQDREYLVGNLAIPARDSLVIVGKRRPRPDAGNTKLVGGSILIGDLINTRVNSLHLENFGIDHGSARNLAYNSPGNFFSAKVGELGAYAYVRGVVALGPDSSGALSESHALAVQGYSRNFINDLWLGKHYHGLVLKGSNAIVDGIEADDLGYSAAFIKSDTGVLSGDVANGTVTNVIVSNVTHRAASTNTTATGVYVMASTATISKVQVKNVCQEFGNAPVCIHGGPTVSDPPAAQVIVDGVICDQSQYALVTLGTTLDWIATNIIAISPATGKAVMLTGAPRNWLVTNVSMLETRALGSTVVMDCTGTGAFDNIRVSSGGTIYTVNVHSGDIASGSIRTGKVSGACAIQNEGNLTPINGYTLDGSDPARLTIMPNNVLKLAGRFTVTGAANKYFCNLPFNTGKQMVFACGAIDSGGLYVSCTVRLNEFQLSIEAPAYSTLSKVDLTNITIPLV